jgi:hypothetical protein
MRGKSWRWAYKRYNRRKPSRKVEAFLLWFCGFMAVMYLAALVQMQTTGNAIRLLVATLLVGAGFAYRRIRLERQKGPNALHQKVMELNG